MGGRYSTSHNKHSSQALATDHMFSVHVVWPFVLVLLWSQLCFPLLNSITLVAHFLVHTLWSYKYTYCAGCSWLLPQLQLQLTSVWVCPPTWYICCAQTSNLRKPLTRGRVTGSTWSVVVGLRRAWAASRARSVGDVDGQNVVYCWHQGTDCN